ncbi:penicillin-binding transpeptidase domain-containing protein, partial [Bacillus cereus]
ASFFAPFTYNSPFISCTEEGRSKRVLSVANLLIITWNICCAIGSNDSSPLQLAGAYAAFGNGGNYNKPHFVKEVTFPDGKKK